MSQSDGSGRVSLQEMMMLTFPIWDNSGMGSWKSCEVCLGGKSGPDVKIVTA